MTDDNPRVEWFTEPFASEGSSFGLTVTEKVYEEQSPFQKVEVYQTTHFGYLMVIDGCVMLTTRDNFLYHEMLAHPALFTHNNPQNVAIIGGGDCGTLREILKHQNVQQVWQIDIDQKVTEAAELFFPELCESNHDPRANILFDDGIQWIQSQKDNSLDVIIIDSTDPVGPAEGLFGESFLKQCHRVLTPKGVLAQQSESPLYHSQTIMKDLRLALRASGFQSVTPVLFPQPVYPSGWWSVTLAGKETSVDSYRQVDVQSKPFMTQYYNDEIHRAALASPEFMKF